MKLIIRKKKFTIIKSFKKHNNNLNIKKTHRQIINYNHYFKSKRFIKIKAQ